MHAYFILCMFTIIFATICTHTQIVYTIHYKITIYMYNMSFSSCSRSMFTFSTSSTAEAMKF